MFSMWLLLKCGFCPVLCKSVALIFYFLPSMALPESVSKVGVNPN